MSKTVAKYQKYVEYKDSGVEWLGKVPTHWNIKRIKETAQIINGYPFDSEKFDPINGTPLVRIRDINSNETQVFFNGSVPKEALIFNSDILIGMDGDFNVSQWKGGEAALNQRVCCLRSNDTFLTKFLSYLLPTRMKIINDLTYFTTVKHLSSTDILKTVYAIPNKIEYANIANFLDHETAKIDSLIEKQQQLIQLLKEKRQAVISHAVTKGLNPNVPMKDSGVEWLGQVPEHWTLKSYRHASRIYRGKFGHRPRNDPAFYDGEYPFIQTGDVARAEKFITTYSQTLNEKGKEVSQLFPKGTLMMAIAANIGDLAILGFEAYAPDSVVGFKPNDDIDLEFLRYSFMAALPALEQTSTQSTQANLNIERIGAVHGVFPSFDEQKKIVNHLDDLLEKYRVIRIEMDKAIQLLQERRTALISAAVTGKIDVRNWQNPNNNNEAKTEFSA
ncbi:restriction endonuclease subunit S [Acinetobacter sp. ANC 4282]|uniref:restriction endonuclease subunit S n=1 Tax=Acinetobacter terrae TaxID=2731247 RepID=UPI00148FB75E|nr:restriction endonuclease subunit S [Acinetobacter terrae]NNH16799.1 restriction endonuclease subunit S [Acinetobacter terrae]